MNKHPFWQVSSSVLFSILFTLTTLALGGCAIDVSTATFVHQDKEVTLIDTTQLHQRVNRDEAEVSITTVQLTNAQGLCSRASRCRTPSRWSTLCFLAATA
ncbi:hypothetical protein IT774_00615 [Salinimonas marina]|uniref:Uncharacterized protein n=1 Tax=Salinimonas marina TaxID=2785918 RepID=A0A7S9HDR3_9ALTE|nr:hypothetical protein [Salinimonas marina]QPG05821.1 hypothetical protein IT774_00615 [Salinimonas marina]